MLKNKKAPARRKAEDDYLLTTNLFCGYCGALMFGESDGSCIRGKWFGFFVFFGKQNEGSFPTAVCSKPYQKKDRITKVTTVRVP